MRATVIEWIGMGAGFLGMVGFVAAAASVSVVLALVVASTFMLGGGVLGVWVASRIPDQTKDGEKK